MDDLLQQKENRSQCPTGGDTLPRKGGRQDRARPAWANGGGDRNHGGECGLNQK